MPVAAHLQLCATRPAALVEPSRNMTPQPETDQHARAGDAALATPVMVLVLVPVPVSRPMQHSSVRPRW
jgi:hypothetical protein